MCKAYDVKLFVDDYRHPVEKFKDGDSWIICRTYKAFVEQLDKAIENKVPIAAVSFDYDLSSTDREYDGADCFKALVRNLVSSRIEEVPLLYIHSEFPGAETKFMGIAGSLSRHLDYKDIQMVKLTPKGEIVLKALDF